MEPLTGAAAAWVHGRRDELNQRFTRAARRHDTLDGEAVLTTLARVLPGVAGPEPAAGDLCSAVYDLVVMHVARGTLARPGIATLLERALPALRPALLQRPSVLPAALSNAVANLGEKGEGFATRLQAVGAELTTPAMVLDAGAFFAWRLGRAALRTSALEAAARLPGRVVLGGLGLPSGYDADTLAGRVLAGLRDDAWAWPGAPPEPGWHLVGWVGDFAGFGGEFARPPTVLEGGDRHTVYAKDGERRWRIDADCFGWMATPAPVTDLPTRAPFVRGLLGRPRGDGLHADGTVVSGPVSATVAGLAGATSFSFQPGRVAAAFPDSHRIVVAVGPR